MFNQLLNSTAPRRDVQLTDIEYEHFKKQFTILGMQGEDYANAFCRYFRIVDYIYISRPQKRLQKSRRLYHKDLHKEKTSRSNTLL